MEESYRPERGRLNTLISSWKAGEPKSELIKKFLNWYPVYTYLFGRFGGEKSYYASVDRFGADCWYAPHNFWREFCHLQGGVALTLPFVWSCRLCLIMNASLFFCMMLKEIFLDAEETQLDFKNLLDAFCWLLGSCFVSSLAFLWEFYS